MIKVGMEAKGIKTEYPNMTYEEVKEMVRLKNEETKKKNRENKK